MAHKRSKKTGLAPGTLVHIGKEKPGSTNIQVLEYDAGHLQRWRSSLLSDCPLPKPLPAVTWVDVEGVSQVEVLQHLGSCFGIHSLVLEDIVATDQRPKVVDYDEYLYVVVKMLRPDSASGSAQTEQVSLVLGSNFLLSFQEGLEGDVLEPVRSRLENEAGRLRGAGPDLLLHALLDIIVDNYFLVLEQLAERIELLEDEVVENPTRSTMQSIYLLRREMLLLHKAAWPLREVVGTLQRRDSRLIHDEAVVYFRDLYDHTVQVVDTLETLRETVSGMLEIYLSSISNRLNEVMKVLTIIATIFMPLSFIAGVYGMNFRHMPELEWRYGYFAVLLVMAAIASVMLLYFKKKRWL